MKVQFPNPFLLLTFWITILGYVGEARELAIQLSSNVVDENEPPNSVVGELSVVAKGNQSVKEDGFRWAMSSTSRNGMEFAVGKDNELIIKDGNKVFSLDRFSLASKWSNTIPDSFRFSGGPYVHADTVLIEINSRTEHVLQALNRETGIKKWEFTSGNQLYNPVFGKDGTIYIRSSDNIIYALELESGKLRWKSQMDEKVYYRPIVGADNMLYVRIKGTLRAMSSSTGETLWSITLNSDQVTVYGGMLFYVADTTLHGIEGQTGKIVWSFELGGDPKWPPTFSEKDLAYVSCRSGTLFALNIKSGKMVWDRPGLRDPTPPCYANGKVFVNSFNDTVYALDGSSGTVVWRSPEGYSLSKPPIMTQDDLLILESSYGVRILDAVSGTEVWSHHLDWSQAGNYGPRLSKLDEVNGMLLMSAYEGSVELKAFDVLDVLERKRASYSLTEGDGDADNAVFLIKDNQLIFKESADFEKKPSYSIRLKASLNRSQDFEQEITIQVEDLIERPEAEILFSPNSVSNGNVGTLNIRYFPKDEKKEEKGTQGEKLWVSDSFISTKIKPMLLPGGGVLLSTEEQYICLDQVTGRVKWKLPSRPGIEKSPLLEENGLLIAWTSSSKLCAVDSLSGAAKWVLEQDGVRETKLIRGPDHLLLLVGEEKQLYAIDIRHGTVSWTLDTKDFVNHVPWFGDNSILYFSTKAGEILALNGNSGVWDWDIPDGGRFIRANAFIGKEHIYVIARYKLKDKWGFVGNPFVIPPSGLKDSKHFSIYALDKLSGSLLWSKDLDSIIDTKLHSPRLSIQNNWILLQDWDPFEGKGGFAFLHPETGEVSLTFSNGKYLWSSNSEHHSPKVFAVTKQDQIHVLDSRTGNVEKVFDRLDQPISIFSNEGSTVFAINNIPFSSNHISAFDIKTGEKEWSFATNGILISVPAMGPHNMLSFGTIDGMLRVIDRSEGKLDWWYDTKDAIHTRPLIDEKERVYVLSEKKFSGKLYALKGPETPKSVSHIRPNGIQQPSQMETDSATFQLVAGEGDSDNALFRTEGGQLFAKEWPLPKDKELFQIRVKGTPRNGQATSQKLVIERKAFEAKKEVTPNQSFHLIPSDIRVNLEKGVIVGRFSTQTASLSAKIDRAKMGTVLWKYKTGGRVKSTPAIGKDGTVYMGSSDWKLYALEGSSGEKKWVYKTKGSIRSSPAIGENHTVYVGSEEHGVYALDSRIGSPQWVSPKAGSVNSTPAISKDGTVYVHTDSGKLYALDGTTGKQLWDFNTGSSPFLNQPSPSLSLDGRVYITGNSILYAVDSQTGKQLWQNKRSTTMRSTPAIGTDGTVYSGSHEDKIHAFDGKSGKLLWETHLGDNITHSPVIGPDGTIYVNIGMELIVAMDGETGKIKWHKRERSGVLTVFGSKDASAALGEDGTLYAGSDEDNDFYALDSQTGKIKWKVTLDEEILSVPVLGENGILYLGAGNSLYAIQANSGPAISPWPMAGQNPQHSSRQTKTPEYSLVSGDRDTNNSAFLIEGNTLKIQDPNALAEETNRIRVSCEFPSGKILQKIFELPSMKKDKTNPF